MIYWCRLLSGEIAEAAEMSLPDHYKTLGVSRTAPARVIKQSFRSIALMYHPDICDDPTQEASARFTEAAEAYHILSDPAERRNYDFRWRLYVEMEGPARFRPQTGHGEQSQSQYQNPEIRHKGPAWYMTEPANPNRNELGPFIISCIAGLVIAMILLPLAAANFAPNGLSSLSTSNAIWALLTAEIFYILVVAATTAIIILTRKTIRRLIEMRRQLLLCRAETGRKLPKSQDE